jgi:CBS domain-containing protein
MTVRDIMSEPVVTCGPETTLSTAARLMRMSTTGPIQCTHICAADDQRLSVVASTVVISIGRRAKNPRSRSPGCLTVDENASVAGVPVRGQL